MKRLTLLILVSLIGSLWGQAQDFETLWLQSPAAQQAKMRYVDAANPGSRLSSLALEIRKEWADSGEPEKIATAFDFNAALQFFDLAAARLREQRISHAQQESRKEQIAAAESLENLRASTAALMAENERLKKQNADLQQQLAQEKQEYEALKTVAIKNRDAAEENAKIADQNAQEFSRLQEAAAARAAREAQAQAAMDLATMQANAAMAYQQSSPAQPRQPLRGMDGYTPQTRYTTAGQQITPRPGSSANSWMQTQPRPKANVIIQGSIIETAPGHWQTSSGQQIIQTAPGHWQTSDGQQIIQTGDGHFQILGN